MMDAWLSPVDWGRSAHELPATQREPCSRKGLKRQGAKLRKAERLIETTISFSGPRVASSVDAGTDAHSTATARPCGPALDAAGIGPGGPVLPAQRSSNSAIGCERPSQLSGTSVKRGQSRSSSRKRLKQLDQVDTLPGQDVGTHACTLAVTEGPIEYAACDGGASTSRESDGGQVGQGKELQPTRQTVQRKTHARRDKELSPASDAGNYDGGRPVSRAQGTGVMQKTLSKLSKRLHGGRFRMLNETLYTSSSAEAFSMMQAEPELFQAYHDGLRAQSGMWKTNPVDLALAWLKRQPKNWTIADFGCGDAKISQMLHNKGRTIHSFDLVAQHPLVTACNIANVPCKSGSCDASVFCLALMGTDYPGFLSEGARVLKQGGFLWIAEVRSRFACQQSGEEDYKPFCDAVQQLGFTIKHQDTSNKMFVCWLFEKHAAESQNLHASNWPCLKPCMYKKR